MKHFVVICCLLASVVAKDKKISLEDIERDNVRSDKSRTPKAPGSPTTFGFVPTKTATDYARQQPKYVQYVPPQQPQQYYYQTQQQQPNLYQQYENVQYVTDNSVAAQQQYYTPQYVYLQQYTAPSTAIQTVVDPKGGIQYVMYIPQYVPKAEQSQNYEQVIYTQPQPQTQQTYVVPETQYVQTQQVPKVKYAQENPAPEPVAVYRKQEPKSLLDSYVPSVLQVQYYKQQQAQANAIQQSLKEVSSPVHGKSDYVKGSYRPQSHNAAESILNYSYQIPTQ